MLRTIISDGQTGRIEPDWISRFMQAWKGAVSIEKRQLAGSNRSDAYKTLLLCTEINYAL
jgi:hypothetical protein